MSKEKKVPRDKEKHGGGRERIIWLNAVVMLLLDLHSKYKWSSELS